MNTKGLSKIWLGGTDKTEEGVWKWTDNRTWEFTSWAIGEPNNYDNNENCLLKIKSGPGWNDGNCQDELRFLCDKNTQSGKSVNFAMMHLYIEQDHLR